MKVKEYRFHVPLLSYFVGTTCRRAPSHQETSKGGVKLFPRFDSPTFQSVGVHTSQTLNTKSAFTT
jgi:hypothetical protein